MGYSPWGLRVGHNLAIKQQQGNVKYCVLFQVQRSMCSPSSFLEHGVTGGPAVNFLL